MAADISMEGQAIDFAEPMAMDGSSKESESSRWAEPFNLGTRQVESKWSVQGSGRSADVQQNEDMSLAMLQ